MAGVAKKTVMRFLVEIGEVCVDYQDRVFRNLSCRRIQLDELWGRTVAEFFEALYSIVQVARRYCGMQVLALSGVR